MVTPAQIAAALGRPTPTEGSPEAVQWALWISDALMLISARLGDLTKLDPVRLDYVVREAVAAQIRRPDDATDVTVSVDDASVSKRYTSATGRVTILPEWWELLAPTEAAPANRAAYAIDTAPRRGWGGAHRDICSIYFGALTCSCGAYLTAGEGPLWEGEGADE